MQSDSTRRFESVDSPPQDARLGGARAVPVGHLGRSTASASGGSAFIAMCLERLPAGRVLNVGAGRERVEAADRTVVYADFDDGVLDGGHLCAASDASQLPFRHGVFEGALLKDVLEHVADPISVLREVRRVCRQDAVIIVTVPRAIPRAVWDDPTHIRGFTSRALATAFEMGGWRVEGRIGRIGSFPGAGRWPWLGRRVPQLMRLPVVGHRFGRNWIAVGRPDGQ